MKQLVVLSGKGGTGKTAVTAALAHLAHQDETLSAAVLADADVDAANLELLVGAEREREHDFRSGFVAWIDPAVCTRCGICLDVCRFDAIREEEDDMLVRVNPIACEGCGACYYQCPDDAIERIPQLCGHWFRSRSRYGPLFHARLRPAQENSGKLVALVKQEARALAREEDIPFMIVDGPPGIGCPAIAAVAEADLALLVAEPTVSGIHDLERALDMTKHFRVRTLVTVNKGNLHPEGMNRIQERCRERGVPVLEWIPFDEDVTRAVVQGFPVTEYQPDSPASWALVRLWEDLKHVLRGEEEPLLTLGTRGAGS